MHLEQFDISIVFLNGDLAEEIFMIQLLGYIDPNFSTLVCLLHQNLYGLCQSAQ